MTIISIGLRAEAERHTYTRRGAEAAMSRTASGEDFWTACLQERIAERLRGPDLEEIAIPRAERDEIETEIVYVEPYRHE